MKLINMYKITLNMKKKGNLNYFYQKSLLSKLFGFLLMLYS